MVDRSEVFEKRL